MSEGRVDTMSPGWLKRQCDLAEKEIRKWPAWKKAAMRIVPDKKRRPKVSRDR